jgi:hypothetical protein
LDSKQAAICRSLRKEIGAVLPKAEADGNETRLSRF